MDQFGGNVPPKPVGTQRMRKVLQWPEQRSGADRQRIAWREQGRGKRDAGENGKDRNPGCPFAAADDPA
jgi:hypothetical protein